MVQNHITYVNFNTSFDLEVYLFRGSSRAGIFSDVGQALK